MQTLYFPDLKWSAEEQKRVMASSKVPLKEFADVRWIYAAVVSRRLSLVFGLLCAGIRDPQAQAPQCSGTTLAEDAFQNA